MILISAHKIGKSFGVRPLFDDLTFVVESKERIGLIGPNGAGKSTLLRILADQISVDSGQISPTKGLRIGFLEQTPKLPLEKTVEEAVLETAGLDEGRLARAAELISKLNLSEVARDPVKKLSGGWQKRVALARELVKQPELLLLDEPTNHLDVESILWLENFLARSEFATVTVTHDRLFLQRVATRMLELDRRNPNGLLNVVGDYATYLERKEELLTLQSRMETKLQNKLRRETEWLRRGAKARTTKQQARIQAHGALEDEVKELQYRNQSKSAKLEFQSYEKKPKRLLEAKKITKAYAGKTLFKDFDLLIGPGDRIGILGNNGCGKSTLIRALLGKEAVDSGHVFRSDHLRVAYFEQNRETLDPTITLRKTLCPHGDRVIYRGNPIHINTYLDRFMFQREQVDMVVGRLSGGEQSRVLLARLMLNDANVLVLDEPTNDLDVETLDILSDCLTGFEGAVFLVTHDRYFLDEVASEIVAFSPKEGELVSFAGLGQWEAWYKEQASAEKRAAKASTPDVPKKKKAFGFNEQREYGQMEPKILALEKKIESLKAEAEKPENVASGSKLTEIYQSIHAAEQELEKLYSRWTELEAIKGDNLQ